MSYSILYDSSRTLCFVGDTWHNCSQHEYWSKYRDCELVSLEYALEQEPEWFKQRQFMCIVSNVSFKKLVVESLEPHNPVWFSIISNSSVIGNNVSIGYNTLVNLFNTIYDNSVIGNHVTLTNYCQLSHEVKIRDYVHVSPYSYLCYSEINDGTCIGLRGTIPGKPTTPVVIPKWTNLLMDSRVTKTIPESGTWYGGKKINSQTSLDVKIL